MTTFKRMMSFLLVLGLLVGMIPPVSASASEAEELVVQETQEVTAPVQTEAAAETQEETEIQETEAVEETEAAEAEETEAAQTEPAETEPAETEPAETEPAQTEPQETVTEETEDEVALEEAVSEEELYSVSNRVEQTITQAEFNNLLNAAKKNGTLVLNARVVLTENVTIPENVRLVVDWRGELVVPAGKRLSVYGGGDIFGYLIVESGGLLEVIDTPLWLNSDSYVDIQGEYARNGDLGCLYRFVDNGTFNGTIFGVDQSETGAYVRVGESSYLDTCLSVFQDPDYCFVTLGVQCAVTLTQDLTLGENRNICVEGMSGNCLTIGNGVTLATDSNIFVPGAYSLVNNGTIELNEGGSLNVDGTMTNNGTICNNMGAYIYLFGTMTNNGNIFNNWDIYVVEGKLVNYGNIDLMDTDSPAYYTLLMLERNGCVENRGTVNCYGGGTVDDRDGIWRYNKPIYHGIPSPVNVSWHKMARGTDGTVHTAMGHAYWEIADHEYGEYMIYIFNADTGEEVYRSNCQFGGCEGSGRSLPSLFEADLPSGNYYFAVKSISYDDAYEDSAPAMSDVFEYTRPNTAIGKPGNVRWVGKNAVWAAPSNADSLTTYEVWWYYAPDADSEPMRRASDINVYGTQKNMQPWMVESCGEGYYSFAVRAIPSDATKQTVGEWVYSEQFYYDPETFHNDESYLDTLESAKPPMMGDDMVFKHLQEPVRLYNDYSLAPNVQLDIASGGSIIVPAGKTLTLNNPTSVYNGGKLIVEEGGKLIVKRDLWVGFDCVIDIRGTVEFHDDAIAWFQYGQSFSMSGIPAENVMVEVIFDAGCTMVENMLSFFENSQWGWTILRIEGDMTLPRSITSPERSNIYIPEYSSLTVPRGMSLNIPQDAMMNVDGQLYNNGTIEGLYTGIDPEALIYISGCGYVMNNGAVIANTGTIVDVQGSWYGNEPVKNGGTVIYPLSYTEFKAQVDAMKTQGGDLNLDRSVTLEGSLTIPNNIWLNVNGGTIIVPSGKTLTISGGASLNDGASVIVEAGGKLVINENVWANNNSQVINNGTVTFGKNSSGEKAKIYFAYDQGNEVVGVPHADQILVMALDNFEFPGWADYKALFENNDYAGCQLEVWGYYKAVLDEDLTVPANGMLIINPSWDDIQNGTRNDWVTINSNVTVYGTLWINARYNGTPCNLEINGNVHIMPGGNLNVSGNVVNNGYVHVAAGAYYNDYKTEFGAYWEGNEPHIEMTEKDLRDQLASGSDWISLNNEIVLTKSLTIPKGVTLAIYGEGSLVVPAGVTLTVNEGIVIFGGNLTVEARAVLKHNGYNINLYNGATMDVKGSVQFKDAWSAVQINRNAYWRPSTVSGVPQERLNLGISLSSENEEFWMPAMDLMENSADDYGRVIVLVTEGTVTLPRSVTIPENALFHVDSNNTALVIPEDCTITNLGEIYVWYENMLENHGTIENHRGFYVFGQMYNYGDVRLNETHQMYESLFQVSAEGYMMNAGNTWVNHEGYLLAVGTWEGNDPIDNGGYITMGRYAILADGADLYAGKSLNLKVWDYVVNTNLTDKQVTWSLAEEYAAYATLTPKGKLTAAKIKSIQTIEVIATVNETGEQITATIDLLPVVSYVAVLDGVSEVNGKTVSVDAAGGNRKFQLEVYPLDLNTAEVMNEMCTWTITDKSGALKTITDENGEQSNYRFENGVFTVEPSGKAGTVTVKVSCNVGTKVDASFKLQFAAYAEKIEISKTVSELVGGNKLTLAATVTKSDGTTTGTEVVWSLKNPADKAYATLSKNVLSAKKVADSREVVLVATSKDGRVSDEYSITILPQDTNILTLKYNGESVTKGTIYVDLNETNTIDLKAHLFGVEEEAENVQWKSSSAKVANVSGGTVTLLKAGSATITATCGKLKTTVALKAAYMASAVTVSGPNEVASGKAVQLKATVKDASAQKVTWRIEQGAEYGKISNSGKFTANKNIMSAQTVWIVATAADGSNVKSEAFEITVRPIAQGVQVYTVQNGVWMDRSNTTLNWTLSQGEIALDAYVFPYYGADNAKNAIQDVEWKSSSAKKADFRKDENGNYILDENGNVILDVYQTGTVTITVTAKDESKQKTTIKLIIK